MSKINKIRVSGTTYDIEDLNSVKVTELTQAEYDALPSSAKTNGDLYIISDAEGASLTNYYTKSETSGSSQISTALNDKIDKSSIVTSISSSSTDAQIPSAKAVYDKLGGLSLVKITQSAYDALATKDSNTLYVIVN